VLVIIAFIGSAVAVTYPTPASNVWQYRNTTFNFEQSVQGNGYFMNYMYVKAGNNLAMKNYAHGSGSINNEAVLSTYDEHDYWHPVGIDWVDYNSSCIQFKEDNAMVYAPMRMAVGNGYYAANPVDYSSLLKEKTWIKNYMAGTSMHHEVEYAHALDKELEIVAKEKFNHSYDPDLVDVAYTQMKINEDVTDGKAHLGILQGPEVHFVSGTSISDQINDFAMNSQSPNIASAWAPGHGKTPSIEIDEDYWGTYHIEKNITLEVPIHTITKSDDWLACPCGSVLDAIIAQPDYYKGSKGFGYNVRPIFDCTCPSVLTQAQFPRVYV